MSVVVSKLDSTVFCCVNQPAALHVEAEEIFGDGSGSADPGDGRGSQTTHPTCARSK